MTPPDSSLRIAERYWRGIILALSGAVILFTIWCLSNGITTVFMHLYYFPIVLLAYRYRWKGCGLATLLALAYLGLSLLFESGQPDVILGAVYRVLVFIGIAAVIAYLSECLIQAQIARQQSAELRERYLSLAPAIILVLDRNGVITHLNENGCAILACSFESVEGRSWIDTFIKESDRDMVRAAFHDLVSGNLGPYNRFENEVVTGTGRTRFIRWYNAPLRDAEGLITGILSYGEDITEEKRAQDSLRDMQQFQESVIANANVWISVLAPDGTILVWNDAAEAISGYKKTTVVGKNTVWKQLYPDKEYRRNVTGEIQRIIGRDMFLENFETGIRCADGTTKAIVWNTRGLRDAHGIVTSYIAIGRDITAQKSAELRAGESSRFLAVMIDTLPIPVFFKDASGKYLGCNPPFEEFIGVKRDQIIGKTAYDIAPKDLADRYTEADQQIFTHPLPQNYETQVQYVDGSRHDVIFFKAPFFNKDGSIAGLIGAFLDITERKRMEEALQKSEEKFRIIADYPYDWEYWIAPDGTYVYMSPSCERITGYAAGEFYTNPLLFSEIIHPDDKAAYSGHMDLSSVSPNPESVEYRIVRKDGSIRWISHICQPMFGRNGELLGRRSSNRDDTESKQAEMALRESEEKYRAFFSTSQDCVFITTIDGRWVDFNDAAVKLFGYDSRNDLMRIDIPHLYANPQNREAHVRYILENEFSFEYPVDLKKKDGTIINALITTVARKDENGNIIGFQGTIRNITERKQTEKLLLANQMQLATAMDLAQLANWEFDIATGIFTFNDRFYAMYGTTAEREGGYQMPAEVYAREFVHPDDAGMVVEEVKKAIETSDPLFMSQVEHRIIRRDGAIRYIIVRHAVTKDAAGRTIKTHGANQDITERKVAENALALEKQRMEALLLLSLMGQKADPEIIAEVVEDAIRLTGSTIGYLATMNDDESVMTMQYWSKSAHESCSVIDKPIVYPLEKTGLWGEAVRQRKPIITNDYAAENSFKRGIPKGHVPIVRHMNIPVFDGGHIVAVAGVGNKGEDYDEGDIRQLQLLMQGWWQVTVRKRAEEQIRLSNVILTTQQETSPDGILVVDESGGILTFNHRFMELWGIPQELIDSRDDERVLSFVLNKLVSPQEFLARVRHLYENRKEKSREEILLNDGTVLERYSAPMISAGDRYFGRVWYFHDITGSRRAENEIKRSIERFKTVMDSIDALVYVVDVRTYELLFINKYGRDIWGEISEGKVCWQTIQSNQDGPCPFCTNNRIIDENGNPTGIYQWEFRNTVNGRWYDCRDSAIRWLDGRLVRLEIATDITGRKQIEEALRESRQLFSDIISFLPDPTFVIDKDGTVLAWNRALEQLSGVPAGDMIGKGDHEYSLWVYGKRRPILIDLVLNPDLDAGSLNYTGILTDGRILTAQTEILSPVDGHRISLSLVASPLIDAQGKNTGAIESMRDITRLKEAEAELARINRDLETIIRDRTRMLEDEVALRMQAEKDVQASLDYTRSVIEANPDLMAVLDDTGVILDVNAAGESLTGIPKERLIGTPYFSYLVEDGTVQSAFAGLLEEGTIENLVRIRRADGHVTPLSVHATVIRGTDGGNDRIIVSARDITHQKHDEEAIRASLEEKVLLLREVHHRVKNNLQIIISLVNLQMRQTDDPGVKQIMSETQNRVRAMSLVHEKLYRSESLSRIDFADYTRYLATQLFSFYGTDTRRVKLDFAMGTIMVDINTAVPLGLIMNELISNALKHAFPRGREGTISIGGGYEGDLITLVVRDDGVGIPAEIDWKNTTSLGLRLIISLTEQVDGTITLDPAKGTSFTITVRRKPESGDPV
jgi:PAS domain S-box-containing protein